MFVIPNCSGGGPPSFRVNQSILGWFDNAALLVQGHGGDEETAILHFGRCNLENKKTQWLNEFNCTWSELESNKCFRLFHNNNFYLLDYDKINQSVNIYSIPGKNSHDLEMGKIEFNKRKLEASVKVKNNIIINFRPNGIFFSSGEDKFLFDPDKSLIKKLK